MSIETIFSQCVRAAVDQDKHETIRLIGRGLDNLGFAVNEECIQVAATALGYIRYRYGRHQDLHPHEVDCGTLTAQAHWIGGLIGIPFIAENQRLAYACDPVEDPGEVLPGDVVVKYRALLPDEAHNHVGIVLGRFQDGSIAVMEAAGGRGIHIGTLENFDPQGGIRRFCTTPRRAYPPGRMQSLRDAARAVPKTRRLGSKLQGCTIQGGRHLGVDIQCRIGTSIVAPCAGTITWVASPFFSAPLLEIVDHRHDGVWRLGNVGSDRCSGETVQQGDAIGTVAANAELWLSGDSGLPSANPRDDSHLHLEFASQVPRGSLCEASFRHCEIFEGWSYFNSLYALKVFEGRLPVTQATFVV